MEVSEIKRHAAGRWTDIVRALSGVNGNTFNGQHQPCPRCGGSDRFRAFGDFAETGGCICNQCGKFADGFATLQWLTGQDFPTVTGHVKAHLGLNSRRRRVEQVRADPTENLEFLPWNDQLVGLWCIHKQPISPDAVKACGGRLGVYRKQHSVIAFPIFGELLTKSDPVGWVIYSATGGMLPKFGKDKQVEWVKVKLTAGSQPGLLLNTNVFSDRESWPEVSWKFEGVTDLLAAVTMNPRFPAWTNANGAGEVPKHWTMDLLAEKSVNILHDADQPGIDGAEKWGLSLARQSKRIRIVRLPYKVDSTHGKDFRDWLTGGGDANGLRELLAESQFVKYEPAAAEESKPIVNEHPDDPDRLALLNLEIYRKKTGGDLKFFQQQWYKWKRNRYQEINDGELRPKVWATVKTEFDRLYFEEKSDFTRKVTNPLVSNVVRAMESYCVVSGNVEMPSWMDGDVRERRNYVAMRNGIVDLDALLEGRDNVLLAHTPKWFSTFCLDYEFDENAQCPKWISYLDRNLEGDAERIMILQEWAGYLIYPRNDLQKFLCIEGEGSNGKSVYLAAMEAMLGRQNCSYVPLESFGGRFDLASTIGKQANICADVGQIDSVCEGRLKSFTSGDPMTFDRKGMSPVDACPTAKLMLSWNNRPRINDSSNGPWRRMILIPFRVEISESEAVRGMDKAWWWAKSGELPGIFVWAVQGLHRLLQNQRFTRSELVSGLIRDYKAESNPVITFFDDSIEEDAGAVIPAMDAYNLYKDWSKSSGHHPVSLTRFVLEAKRKFPKARHERQTGVFGKKKVFVGLREKSA